MQKSHDKNKVKLNKETLNRICEVANLSKEDALYIVNYFKHFHTLNDYEILCVFDDEQEEHCKYYEMAEIVFKDNPQEMFLWIHDYKYAANDIVDFIIPECCAGKTLAEAYVYSSKNIITLSDGTCVFIYE
ncbi:MAG: hypothetical protein IJ086_05715 [Clostridium sp.]|nr:hypothetical protein [Clostridium sp.]